MKNFVVKYSAWVLLIVMVAMLIPGISLRINSEENNKNITISLLYNNIVNKLSDSDFEIMLDMAKDAGINNISVMEDDLNYLVAKGDVTSIKYNVLRHKYDLESIEIARLIKEKCPDVSYDSYVIIIDDEITNQKFEKWLPLRYTDDQYIKVGTLGILNIYILLNGRVQTWDYAFGYDEAAIASLKDKGFNVSLVHKVKDYDKTDYIDEIEHLVKKYDIEFINLKKDTVDYETVKDANKDNYKQLADVINNNDMTLVVTENTDNLSNQKYFGYNYVFDKVMGEGGSHKVVRSFETYDDSASEQSNQYKYRAEQFINSTIDRNSRFITVTLMEPSDITYTQCAEYTIKAAELYKERMEQRRFIINADVNKSEYFASERLNGGLAAVIMILCLLLMLQMVTEYKNIRLTIAAIILAALAFAATLVLPESLLGLYPTVFCTVQSCFAMTCVMYFVKKMSDRLNTVILAVGCVAILLGIILLGSVALGTLLSGIEYYINNRIFRGIKLSLMVPVGYTTLVFYVMFMKNTISGIVSDIKTVMFSQIKVYWVLLAGIVGYVGMYYIIRSGNVASISNIEALMRSTLTELFIARPRTKEFLIGYPALVLFAYYMKNVKIDLLRWLLAIAASILAASVTNSFCHVFTDYSVIVSRTFNGLLVGVPIAILAYVGNIILVNIVKIVYKKFN